jgi:magnesium-transporting ATPase (P-type)
MDAAMMNVEENQRLRVSITTRLFAMVAFTIPLIGGALSSFTLMSVFKALRSNETAGLGAIMAGMKEASLPAIISLYLAAVFAFVVIVVLVVRMFVQTKTASPPFWYFVLGGILCLLPAAAFWKAQLLVFEVLSPGSTIGAAGISGVAADLSQLLWMSIIAAPIVFVVAAGAEGRFADRGDAGCSFVYRDGRRSAVLDRRAEEKERTGRLAGQC